MADDLRNRTGDTALKELDTELSRQITVFHTSRRVQVRHGRQVAKENKIYFRWCFPDLTTAARSSNGLVEQSTNVMRDEARRIAAKFPKLQELLRKSFL